MVEQQKCKFRSFTFGRLYGNGDKSKCSLKICLPAKMSKMKSGRKNTVINVTKQNTLTQAHTHTYIYIYRVHL